jgi:hypothetical protein
MSSFQGCNNKILGVVVQNATVALPCGAVLAHLRPQAYHCQINYSQVQQCESARGVLGQAAVAHLHEDSQPLDRSKDVFHPGANLGIDAVVDVLDSINDTVLARPLIGEGLGLCLGLDQRFLTGVGIFAVHAPLLTIQQRRRRIFIVQVGAESPPRGVPPLCCSRLCATSCQ